MRARLYYEAHVTVENAGEWEAFKSLWADGWRVSRFDEDEVDDYHGKWFMSCRHEDLDMIRKFVAGAVKLLEIRGYTVLRWKVEDTVLDSKHGDRLEELST